MYKIMEWFGIKFDRFIKEFDQNFKRNVRNSILSNVLFAFKYLDEEQEIKLFDVINSKGNRNDQVLFHS